jgi:steroid delta-isomerase-like uncharacterized protein
MTTGQNKAIVRRFIEASIASDPAPLKELLAADFVAYIPTGAADREAFVKHNNVFVEAFSGKEIVVEDLIAEEDKVVVRATWKGTHSGTFQGIPPTGKQISIGATLFERLKDGKLVEHRSLFDSLAMMQQLGLIPKP